MDQVKNRQERCAKADNPPHAEASHFGLVAVIRDCT
jgi:hypothetical protein